MSDEVIICRCEEITRAEIVDALRQGVRSLDDVKRWTRCGMGACQGKTCSNLVREVIAEETGQDLGEVAPMWVRPPVRPLPLAALARSDDPGQPRDAGA